MRVLEFVPEQLDWLATSGTLVWVGVAALGPRDGKVMLLRRERAPLLLATGDGGPFPPLHTALLDHLRHRGASFLTELEHAAHRAVPGTTARGFEAALWDLVWAGRITNDSFAPLRALLRGPKSGERRHASQTLAGGRWSLVSDLLPQATDPTGQALAWSEVLLERYGVLSREAVAGEAVPGGWVLVRQALKAMEEAGRLRRGYFVEGLAGVQYALPGAVERLRDTAGEEGTDARILAALDPANPYGALLPWPEGPGAEARPRRIAGAWVVLVQGRLVLFLYPGGRNLLTFLRDLPDPREFLAVALRALARVPPGGRRHFTVQHVDGREIWDSPWHDLMLENGFAPDYGGLRPQGST